MFLNVNLVRIIQRIERFEYIVLCCRGDDIIFWTRVLHFDFLNIFNFSNIALLTFSKYEFSSPF